MIKIFHLKKSFPAKAVVFNELGLRIHPGEFAVLCGDTGRGKSCLLRIIGGYLAPDSGQVIVAGKNLNHLDEWGRIELRREVSLVTQEGSLLADRSVEENISFALRVQDVGRRKVKALVARWLDTFALADFKHALPGDLARGEQVKVMLARALAVEPKLLLVDEPTANLDAATGQSVMAVIREAHTKGLTTLLTTKDSKLSIGGVSRVIELRDGKAVERY